MTVHAVQSFCLVCWLLQTKTQTVSQLALVPNRLFSSLLSTPEVNRGKPAGLIRPGSKSLASTWRPNWKSSCNNHQESKLHRIRMKMLSWYQKYIFKYRAQQVGAIDEMNEKQCLWVLSKKIIFCPHLDFACTRCSRVWLLFGFCLIADAGSLACCLRQKTSADGCWRADQDNYTYCTVRMSNR